MTKPAGHAVTVVLMRCDTCKRDFPTKLVRTRHPLDKGCWWKNVRRTVVEHGCPGQSATLNR